MRRYIGQNDDSLPLEAAPVVTQLQWNWDTWCWVEVEVAGTSVKARIYAEAAAAPDWQLTGTTDQTAPGAFGPGGFSRNGQVPAIDVKRLEYHPLASQIPVIPSVPLDTDWTLAQFTEQS